MKNILFYFTSLEPSGGIERVIACHANFLATHYNVTVLTKNNSNSYFDLSHKIRTVNFKCIASDNSNRYVKLLLFIISIFSSSINLRRNFEKNNYDLVYTATPQCLLELFLSGFNFSKVIVTEHASFEAYNIIYKLIIKFLYPRVKFLFVPTKHDSALYKNMHIDNVYLPNPLPFKTHTQSNCLSKIALCVGRLTADKRHDLLVYLWSKSEAPAIGWKLKIIGSGECKQSINNCINSINMHHSIELIESSKNIENYYKDSSLFLLTSRTEGFGMVILEAMSFGLPVIAFNCLAGPRDLVQNNSTGFLINESDYLNYIKKINFFINNISDRRKYGRAGLEKSKSFEAEKICLELFESINSRACKSLETRMNTGFF
jgi:glycosyltransferase involved in cell wall biosynthesis